MSEPEFQVRRLGDPDVEAFVSLRKEALHDSPLSFGASPATDHARDAASVRARMIDNPDSVLLGAFQNEDSLVGCVGLHRDRLGKSSHRAHVWGMYVTGKARGRGVGAMLIESALQQARSMTGIDWVQLSVSTTAPGAQRLYERAGFQVWGTEPDALRHEGESADEHYMALRL